MGVRQVIAAGAAAAAAGAGAGVAAPAVAAEPLLCIVVAHREVLEIDIRPFQVCVLAPEGVPGGG